MDSEKDALCGAVDEFAKSMKKRLLSKMKEGFKGWDDGDLDLKRLSVPLLTKAENINRIPYDIGQKEIVDVANFAMMLYFRQYREDI